MNKISSIILLSVLTVTFVFCKEKKIMKIDESKIKKWKYGFSLNDKGKILSFNYSNKAIVGKQKFSYFRKSENEINNISGSLINSYIIRIRKSRIRIEDVTREKPGLSVSYKEIKHKIENNRSYVSADGKKWELLIIKDLRNTGKKNRFNNPLILVNFECSFFKGEYEFGFRL